MKNVYTVGQINAYVRNMFAQDFLLNSVTVKGELSNVKYHGSGHIYFTLKDDKGSIAAVMFSGARTSGLKFRMEDGQKVLVTGHVDVYERDGKYQLYAKKITLDGEGDLFIQFELLKKELEEMGMFDPMYKKPIPKMIRTLGVVTAPTGAAIQDIIHIAGRRNPYVQIILYPALVQGDGAADSIVKGIHMLEKYGVDVMIVGRGGGSYEDLWAFNERKVVQAVFDCSIPVISAVGHETDTTLIDFVSDLRAPTPSAGAELAVCEVDSLMQMINGYEEALRKYMKMQIGRYRLLTDHYETKVMRGAPVWKVREKRNELIGMEERIDNAMKMKILRVKHQRDLYIQKLKGASPLEKISKGFCYVSDQKGDTLRTIDQVAVNDRIQVFVKDGRIDATVTGLEKKQ